MVQENKVIALNTALKFLAESGVKSSAKIVIETASVFEDYLVGANQRMVEDETTAQKINGTFINT